MREVARVAFVLFGIFLLVEGMVSCTATSVQQLQFGLISDNPVADWFGVVGLTSGMVLFVSVVPGALLINYSGTIARRLFSELKPEWQVSAEHAYVVGCSLLAIMFAVRGAAGLVGAAVYAGFGAFSESEYFYSGSAAQTAASSIVSLALAWLLHRHALRSALPVI